MTVPTPPPSPQPGQPPQPPYGQAPQPPYGQAPAAAAPKSKNRWLIPVVVGAAVLFLCCAGGVVTIAATSGDSGDRGSTADAGRQSEDRDESEAGGKAPAPATEPEDEAPEPEEPEPTGFGAGTWEVGAEIPPGTYVTDAGDGLFESCYWARLSGFSGDFDDLIANEIVEGGSRGRVTIAEDDAGVEFTGDCRWVEESEAEPVDLGDGVGAGVWRVGDEVEPGTYVTTAPDGALEHCYWARLSGFSGDFDDLIANDLIEPGSRGRVEISSSDTGIKFTGDCVWTRN